jgi:short subunit dehydrogenase-like uncharacterized protein
MPIKTWMIYGATGYSGRLVTKKALEKGLKPVLAGRESDHIWERAADLGLECRAFSLDHSTDILAEQLKGIDALISCAGPFSATARPMIEACIKAGTHYFDITGEMEVFEFAHSREIDAAAKAAGISICPGIGFDVIPTDCLARALVEELPDATELHLGFSGDMAVSPGTAKSMIEGFAIGTMARRNGKITPIPLEVSDIDYGNGMQQSMSVSWGDVSTAWYTTGIPNITVSWPASNSAIFQARMSAWLRPLLRQKWLQEYLKKQVDKRVKGPGAEKRDSAPVHVWGEARNAAGDKVTARIQTANGYSVTCDAPPLIIQHLMENDLPSGSHTPSRLFGKDFICTVPGSTNIQIS